MVHNHDLEVAAKALAAEKLVLLPTDTVWSIACLAYAPEAVHALTALKGSNEGDLFEVLVASVDALKQEVEHLHPRLETLLHYHVRPLTIVLDRPLQLPAGLRTTGRLGYRIPQDPFCRELLQRVETPLIVASANVAGAEPPAHFGNISSDIIQGVDYVVKFRQGDKQPGEESVKVRLSNKEELIFLRE